ncbi:MAG: radical SAM protein [archaeon]
MRIQLFSIVAGSEACNARCPFCVSKMTPAHGITLKEPVVNWRNFEKACQFARVSNVSTAMITGKGEPTLYPNQITEYVSRLSKYEIPLMELQTNGIPIADDEKRFDEFLQKWYEYGLTTIAISIVHYLPERNRQIYLPYRKSYIDLPTLIHRIHAFGMNVRLACVLVNGFIDSVEEVKKMIEFARENKVEQLTLRPVNKPVESRNPEVFDWTTQHHLPVEKVQTICDYLNNEGHRLMQMEYGATIYDVGGQNVCLTNSLTLQPTTETIRQLIFLPNGHLVYDWQYAGAILL